MHLGVIKLDYAPGSAATVQAQSVRGGRSCAGLEPVVDPGAPDLGRHVDVMLVEEARCRRQERWLSRDAVHPSCGIGPGRSYLSRRSPALGLRRLTRLAAS